MYCDSDCDYFIVLTNTMLNQNIVEFKTAIWNIAGILAFYLQFFTVIVPAYIYPGQTLGKKICKIKIVKVNNEQVSIKICY
ncbi:MAG: RDD family protein [Streptococcus sp.]